MKKRIFNIKQKTCANRLCTKAVLAGIFSVLVFFSSCSNAFLDGGSASGVKTGTVTGSIDFGGALPKEILEQLNSSSKNSDPQGERTAFPSSLTASSVEVYAQIGSDTDTRVDASADLETKKYSIGNLTYGKEYTITAKFKNVSEKIIMQGSVKVTLSDDEPVVNKNISVAPTQTEGDKGSISLDFSVAADVGWSSSNVDCSYVFDNYQEQPMPYRSDGKFTLRLTAIPSGAHSVKFIFKQKDTDYILYQFTETINVFDNLTTNKWVKNGNEPYFTISESCQITKDCVDKFAQKTFYVDSSRQTTNSSGAGYTTQSGTYFNPYVNVISALNRIQQGPEADYTIYVKDGYSKVFGGIQLNKNISIETYKDAPGDGLGSATLTMNKNTECLSIASNVNFNLKNFILDGNNNGNNINKTCNGGIISNSGNTTLINCELKNVQTSGSGGAIYNTGTLTLKKSKIIGCSCKSDTDSFGGAIYNEGTLTLDDVVISGCNAIAKANSSSYKSFGGGIYNAGTCNIKKAIITGCKTTSKTESNAKGGAIYNKKGSLTLGDSICNSDGSPDVTIGIGSYNGTNYSTPNEAFKGAGVFSGEGSIDATFTMNKDCVIGKYNPTSAPSKDFCGNRSIAEKELGNGGAGVFISDSNKTMTINGGFISYNYAENRDDDRFNSKKPITGVGLYYSGNKDNPEIKNLVISYNKAYIEEDLDGSVQGVGFYFGKSVTLNNVKVENNTYETLSETQVQGKGLYAMPTSTVTLKDTTYFGTDDDIYLEIDRGNNSKIGTIKVDSNLNPQNISGVTQQYVATITPGSYEVWQILEGSEVATEYAKFKVKPENDDSIPFHIGSDGKLFSAVGIKPKGAALAVGDIVFNDGSSTPYSVIASRNPVQCKDYEKNAAVAVIYKAESNKAYGVGIKLTTNIAWCIEASQGDDINFTNTVSTNDGILNLKRMISQGADDTGVTCLQDGTIDFDNSVQATLRQNYPAFEFAYYYGKNDEHNTLETDYETGWYLPSMSELSDICNAYTSTDNALSVTGGDRLYSRYFLSSNQGNYTNYTKTLCLATRQEGGYYTYIATSSACAVRAFTW